MKSLHAFTVNDARSIADALPRSYGDRYLKKAQLALSEIASFSREVLAPVDCTSFILFADYQLPECFEPWARYGIAKCTDQLLKGIALHGAQKLSLGFGTGKTAGLRFPYPATRLRVADLAPPREHGQRKFCRMLPQHIPLSCALVIGAFRTLKPVGARYDIDRWVCDPNDPVIRTKAAIADHWGRQGHYTCAEFVRGVSLEALQRKLLKNRFRNQRGKKSPCSALAG